MSVHERVEDELEKLSNPEHAMKLQGFFKTAEGEYGEGDIFLGIKVPVQRKVAKKYLEMELKHLQKLLNSKIHEHRLIALFILIDLYKKAKNKKEIFDFYLKNTKNINNWDLVDLSAPNIVGDYLLDRSRKVLYKLARSKHLWEKRIAILATAAFIKVSQFEDTLKIAEILLKALYLLQSLRIGLTVKYRSDQFPQQHR